MEENERGRKDEREGNEERERLGDQEKRIDKTKQCKNSRIDTSFFLQSVISKKS